MRPRVLWAMVARNISQTASYRGAFFILMITTVITPMISLLVWLTVSEQGVPLPYNRSQFVTYYLVVIVASMLTATWLAPYVAQHIRLGTMSIRLLRPVPPILEGVGNNVGEKIVKLPLLLPLVICLAAIFHNDVRLPTQVLTWMLFAGSLALAGSLAFLLDYSMGLLAFWLQDVTGLYRVRVLVAGFLAGEVLPLALLPSGLSAFTNAQPFRFTLSFPVEIIVSGLSGTALWQGFLLQGAWCLLFWVVYRVLWKVGLRSYSAVGA